MVSAVDLLEIVLTFLGLGLPWLKRPVERAAISVVRRVATAIARLRGLPPRLSSKRLLGTDTAATPYADRLLFSLWDHEVFVAADGDTRTTVRCTAVNVSPGPVDELCFPLYFDLDSGIIEPRIELWAASRRRRLKASLDWPEGQTNGTVRVELPSPLRARRAVSVVWGYSCPAVFDRPGDHWFDWYIAFPQAYFRLAFEFDSAWALSGLRSSVLNPVTAPPPARRLGNGFRWIVAAPVPGCTYRVDWRLARSAGSERL